jgi:hypothetical protein
MLLAQSASLFSLVALTVSDARGFASMRAVDAPDHSSCRFSFSLPTTFVHDALVIPSLKVIDLRLSWVWWTELALDVLIGEARNLDVLATAEWGCKYRSHVLEVLVLSNSFRDPNDLESPIFDVRR